METWRRSVIVAVVMAVAGILALGVESAAAANGRIAFVRDGQIYSVRPDGTGVRQLTRTSAAYWSEQPTWSPNGGRIAFSRCSQYGCRVWVMRRDGTHQHSVGPSASSQDPSYGYLFPSWGPSGMIAFLRADGTWTMHPDGTHLVRRTTIGAYPAWAPLGGKLAFTGFDEERRLWQLWTMNLDGSHLTNLLPYHEDSVEELSWYPASRIAFAGWTQMPPVEETDVYLIRPDGSHLVNLTFGAGVGSYSPSWSPDATRITFQRSDYVYTMRADGSHVRQLVAGDDPSWGAALTSG